MSRARRQAAPQTFLHVWNRGVRKTAIFLDDDDHRIFLRCTERRFAKYGIVIHAFCLVGNHYHFLIYDPDGLISKAMQELGSTYARYFNDRYELVGPLYQGRFESRHVRDDGDLLNLSRYIHRNALDVNPTAPIDAYHWSSYRSYVSSARPATPLSTSLILSLSGSPDAYRRLVETANPSDERPTPGAVMPPTTPDPAERELDRIERAVARHFHEPRPVFWPSGGRTNPVRSAAVLIAADTSGAARATLVERYGFTKPNDLSSTLTKLRRRETTNPKFHRDISAIRRQLAA